MRICILGARGMLGSALVSAGAGAGIETIGLDIPEVDITREADLAARVPPADWVVNSAAYTHVDRAEEEREAASAVNCAGARNLARLCAARRTPLLHISTDYVFDGFLRRPYREDDRPNPLNYYGRTKLEGEQAIQAEGGRFLIVRTQSLFGPNGRNFVDAVISRLRASPEPLRIVDDQVSCPTFTRHLTDAIVRLLTCGESGIVHVSASGECSWFQLACAVAERVKPGAAVRAIRSEEYKSAAKRPAYSVLDKQRFASWTGRRMPEWEEGLEAHLREARVAGGV